MRTALRCAAALLILHALSASAGAADYRRLYGDPASAAAASYTIVIRPDTRYVNVTGGDTVNFIVGDKSFAWAFNVARTVWAFDLNEVAPPGMLDHKIRAYVAPDPKYIDAP